MEKYKKTAVVDIDLEIDESLKETVHCFLEALEYVEVLYHLQNSSDFSQALENSFFQKIMNALRKGSQYLCGEQKYDLEERLSLMSKGAYDLFPITLKHCGEDYMDLITGKIFSLDVENRRRYSGAVGLVNKSFDNIIQVYDSKLDLFAERLPFSVSNKNSTIRESAPVMRCIDVFSLAGELNIRHKPICVFFSGGAVENLSSLSKLTVFINLYVLRFRFISKEIARAYMLDYPLIENIDRPHIAKILLIWLRGHDLGHFYGDDSLKRSMSEFDKDYLILHELKSDMVSLYNLRQLQSDLLSGHHLVAAYVVFIAEMFRYIRRGRFHNYPDTASAFLMYCHLREDGVITFDSRKKKFKLHFDKLESGIENLAGELFQIFAEGNVSRARELVNRWGKMQELGQVNLPGELAVLEDTEVPYFIDFNFITKDKILFGK